MNKRRGVVLIEVLVSMILIGMLVIAVSNTLVSSYALSTKLSKLPGTYISAQDETERQMAELNALVSAKYRLENEMRNQSDRVILAETREQYQKVTDELRAYETGSSQELFGKSVDVYRFSETYTSSDSDFYLSINAGVANMEPYERPVPIVNKVEIARSAADHTDIYFSVGQNINTKVEIDDKNHDYLQENQYRWFISTGGYHTMDFTTAIPNDGTYAIPVLATFPSDYTLLTSETGDHLTIKEDYAGCFVKCVVTPLSTNGKMGRSVESNSIYISAMPESLKNKCKMLIDPSFYEIPYSTAATVRLNNIDGRYPSSSKMRNNSGTNAPYLNIQGEATDASGIHFSRFIEFGSSTYLRSTGISSCSAPVAAAVVRGDGTNDYNFIQFGTASAGFADCREIVGAGDWKIVIMDIYTTSRKGKSVSEITVGYADLDLVELVVLDTPSDSDLTDLKEYFKAKYFIE